MEKRVESSSRPMAPRYHAHAPAVPLPLALPLLSLGPDCASASRKRFGQTFRPSIDSKRFLDWHFMTTSGTAAACGAAARPRAMCPLARRAPSAASPQRFSPSLSFSLALSLALFLFASWSSQVRLHRRRALRPRRRVRRGGVIWAAAQWCVVCGVGVWCVVCDRT